jgi:hypothetical protein
LAVGGARSTRDVARNSNPIADRPTVLMSVDELAARSRASGLNRAPFYSEHQTALAKISGTLHDLGEDWSFAL